MKELKTRKGAVSLVDDDVFEWASKMTWHLHKGRTDKHGYFSTNVLVHGKYKYRTLHSMIVNAPAGMIVDHINRNTLDNQRSNLRVASRAQNSENRSKFIKPKTSRFKGVSWHPTNRRWAGKIRVNRRLVHLGYFHDEVEAAKAYNEAAQKHFGKFACLNDIPHAYTGRVAI